MPKLAVVEQVTDARQEKCAVLSIFISASARYCPLYNAARCEKPILREVSIGIPLSFQITQVSFLKDPAGTPSEFVSNLSKLAVSHIVPFFMRFVMKVINALVLMRWKSSCRNKGKSNQIVKE
jgi:hypothetical protein